MRLLPWLAKISFAAFLAALVVMLVAGFGTRLGIWGPYTGIFAIYPWGVCLALAGFCTGAVWGVWAVIANRAALARYGIMGLLGCGALLVSPIHDLYAAMTSPRIHDISSDTDHPPTFVTLMGDRSDALTPPSYDGPQPAAGPNGKISTTAQLQKKYYPNIFSHADLTSPDKLFARALKTAYAMGWNVVDANAKQGRIEATDTSLLFGLTADIVIRVKAAGMGARLDIRSKSRVPIWKNSDLGRNAARVRSYLKTLSKTY